MVLKIKNGEGAGDFLKRLKKAMKTDEWATEKRREEFLQRLKSRGKPSGPIEGYGKKSPGAQFHSPKREK